MATMHVVEVEVREKDGWVWKWMKIEPYETAAAAQRWIDWQKKTHHSPHNYRVAEYVRKEGA